MCRQHEMFLSRISENVKFETEKFACLSKQHEFCDEIRKAPFTICRQLLELLKRNMTLNFTSAEIELCVIM